MATTPNLITLEFLQDLLTNTEPGLIVTSFKVTAGSGRGDNYTATLYRVQVEGKVTGKTDPWSRSLIYKCLPMDPAQREAFKSDTLFKNEVAVYTRALPALMEFQGDRGLFKAVPQCYLARSDVLVLEDLKTRGFVMVDRKVGLDYHHCKAVVSELAHFHALSLSMKRIDPTRFKRDVSDSITEAMFVIENEAWYRDYYKTASRNAIAMVKQTLPEGEMMKQCLEKLQHFVCDSTFFSKMVYLVQPREPVAVLTHGDCWTNNILFHYSETGQILEVCLVDFQMARYGSPALDLANLLYCCTSLELRQKHMDNLLEHYHTTLIAAMMELERGRCRETVESTATQPEHLREILREEMHRCGKFGLGLALDMIPISTCDSDQAPDLYVTSHEDVMSEGEDVLPVWTCNELCRQRMTDLVQELVEKGDL